MIRQANRTCASCAKFPPDAIKAEGRGLCAIKEVAFNFASPACPIYDEATDRAERKALVVKITEAKGD